MVKTKTCLHTETIYSSILVLIELKEAKLGNKTDVNITGAIPVTTAGKERIL
jgi:hypothetical protein